MTWTVGEHSRYELEPAREHFAVLRAAQLVDHAYHGASLGPFQALLLGHQPAARWLEAMEKRGVLDQRAAMLRVVIAKGDDASAAVEAILRAAGNVEVVSCAILAAVSHGTQLPLLRRLSFSFGTLAGVAEQREGYHLPILRTLINLDVGWGPAPVWPSSCAASLHSLHLSFPSAAPGQELMGLDRLIALRNLHIGAIRAGELSDLFGYPTAPAPAVQHLSLDMTVFSIEDLGGDAEREMARIEKGCAHVAASLPGLVTLSLSFRHSEKRAAEYLFAQLARLLDAASRWPMLLRIDSGLATADDAGRPASLRGVCLRPGIELEPLIGCARRPRCFR